MLVRDNGYLTETQQDALDPSRITAGVRFVTQYVLRIDIETGVKDVSQMNHSVFEHGSVQSESGLPVAKTFLVNPTEFAFECAVRGTIESATTSRPKPFRLTLPSRINVEGEERYLVRIMPRSKVRLTAPVDDLLFPGSQSLRVEATNGRRTVVDQTFAVNVGQGDFPALEVAQAYLDHELAVHPAQVEVGSIAGTKRTCNLRFTNNSIHGKSVTAEVVDIDGNVIQNVHFSSQAFDVKLGRTHTIRVAIGSDSGTPSARYGDIRLTIRGEDGAGAAKSVPLAMLFGAPPTP